MPGNTIIAASILAADRLELGKSLLECEAGGADWIHIDVMDGHFVPSIAMGPRMVKACKRGSDLPLDVHLMITNPDDYLEVFADAGADSITVHVEARTHLHRTLATIQELGCRAGVALNPATPVNTLMEVVSVCDLILVMTVNPGFGGQRFIEATLKKVEEVQEISKNLGLELDIQVDGGIDSKTAQHTVAAGANVLVAGTSIFQHPQGITEGIQAIRASFR